MKPRGMQGPPAIGQGFVLARRVTSGPNLEGAAGQPTDCRAGMRVCRLNAANMCKGLEQCMDVCCCRGFTALGASEMGPGLSFHGRVGCCCKAACGASALVRSGPVVHLAQAGRRRWRAGHRADDGEPTASGTLRSAASEAPQQSGTPVGAGAARVAAARRFRTRVSTMLRRSASKGLHYVTLSEKGRCWGRDGRGLARAVTTST